MTFKATAEFNQTVMTQQVYEQLRKVICSGNWFKPGERINVDQICIEWQVSKTPVREALKALEQEGAINYIPRRGFFVTVPSLEELRNIIDIRIALEVHALERSFQDMDRGRIREILKSFQAAFKTLRVNGDVHPYLAIDHQFHSFIIMSSGNRKLAEIYENIGGEMHYLRYRDTFDTEAAMGNSMPEHTAVIEAILNNDKKKAMQALSAHLRNVEARLVELSHVRDRHAAGEKRHGKAAS
jgi:DNA-binding GntR family transcriptional regulator